MSLLYKTVLMPIEVPYGEYCDPCKAFDCEGGHPHCYRGFRPLRSPDESFVFGEMYLKDLDCLGLKHESI